MLKEIKPASTINAVIRAPSSKSYTNRSLIVASLADGISYLKGCLLSDDTEHMIKALQQVGIQIISENDNLIVMGRSGRVGLCRSRIHVGNAGTTFRFLTTFLALGHGNYTLDGDERMRERPIKDLTEALNQMNIKVHSESRDGYPPLIIRADGIPGGKVVIKGENSSQYLSSLLMSAPYAKSPLEIEVIGDLVSKPYVDMTLSVMNKFGVEVTQQDDHFFRVTPQKYQPTHYSVEGDASNASYFFAAAAITGGKVRVTNIFSNTSQGDIHFLSILRQMGCNVQKGTDWIEVKGNPMHGIEADLKNMPDMVQTLAIVALFSEGETVIKNIAHLKIKETDRLRDLAIELKKIGAKVMTGENYVRILRENLRPSIITTYNDHRMAMSFAVAGLKIPGIQIEDPMCVKKSFPDFWERFEGLYATTES